MLLASSTSRFLRSSPGRSPAAVEEAKTLGLHITAHGGGGSDTIPPTMTKVAIEAGVECIEHLNEMDDEALDMMAEKGVFNVPTLQTYYASYQRNDISSFLIEKRGWSMAMHEALFKKPMPAIS